MGEARRRKNLGLPPKKVRATHSVEEKKSKVEIFGPESMLLAFLAGGLGSRRKRGK